MSLKVTLDTKVMDRVIANAARLGGVKAKVGVVGRANFARTDGNTNAEIGFSHEFGVGVPRRSFLRMPLQSYELTKRVEARGDSIIGALASPAMFGAITPLAEAAVQCVDDSFEEHGSPQKWRGISLEHTEPVRRSQGHPETTLVDLGELRRSIGFELV